MRNIWFVFLINCLFYAGYYHLQAQAIDWSKPETIDPLKNQEAEYPKFDIDDYKQRAMDAYKWTRYSKAAQYYLAILHFYPDDLLSLYNLSCCYGQMGEAELAFIYLMRALDMGFNNYDLILKEKDFKRIKNDPWFKLVMDRVSGLKQGTEQTIYTKATKLVKSRIFLPDNFHENMRYPLIIGLHGSGGSSESFKVLWDYAKKQDFIFVVPEGTYPVRHIPGKNTNMYSWAIGVKDKNLWERGDPYIIATILEVVEYVKDNYKVNDIYMLGHSQGAAYAYITAIKNPELFAGIIAFGGALPLTTASYSLLSENEIKKANTLAVFIGHGKNDFKLGIKRAIQSKELLKDIGYKVTFYEHNSGHNIPAAAFNKALDWIR